MIGAADLLGGAATNGAHHVFRDGNFRGRVMRAPASEDEPLLVAARGYTDDHPFLVPAGQWQARGSALPARGAICLISFDHAGDAWVPIWKGDAAFPAILDGGDAYDGGGA